MAEPKVTVTRADREAALLSHSVAPHHLKHWEGWLEVGGDVFDADGYSSCMVEENATAKAIAQARAEGAAEERAAVLRWLRLPSPSAFDGELTVADEIERGEHRVATSSGPSKE